MKFDLYKLIALPSIEKKTISVDKRMNAVMARIINSAEMGQRGQKKMSDGIQNWERVNVNIYRYNGERRADSIARENPLENREIKSTKTKS